MATENVESNLNRQELIVETLDDLFARLEPLKQEKGTLWFGITGSWRKTSSDIENDVRAAVRRIIERGDGIVSGGALAVDFYAPDEALKLDPKAEKIKIFLPVSRPKPSFSDRYQAMSPT